MLPKETLESGVPARGDSPWMNAGHSVREQIEYFCEPNLPGPHQREMAFLRHLMLYGNAEQCRQLEEKLTRAEQLESRVRRAMALMVVLSVVAALGLGYAAVLLEDSPPSQFRIISNTFCALGLASLISLVVFAGLWLISRANLSEHREDCRRLVTRIVASRLGSPPS